MQHPEEQAHVALVLRGKKGTGKTFFAKAVLNLFGQHGLSVYHQRHLAGNFNAHLRDAVLVVADEAFFAGDKQCESVLKGMITDPMIVVEGKGKDAVFSRNRMHIIMISNAEWIVNATPDERRYSVLEVGDEHAQDLGYFEAVEKQLQDGGYSGMLYDLQNRDISAFNVRNAIETDALSGAEDAQPRTVTRVVAQ